MFLSRSLPRDPRAAGEGDTADKSYTEDSKSRPSRETAFAQSFAGRRSHLDKSPRATSAPNKPSQQASSFSDVVERITSQRPGHPASTSRQSPDRWAVAAAEEVGRRRAAHEPSVTSGTGLQGGESARTRVRPEW